MRRAIIVGAIVGGIVPIVIEVISLSGLVVVEYWDPSVLLLLWPSSLILMGQSAVGIAEIVVFIVSVSINIVYYVGISLIGWRLVTGISKRLIRE